MGASDGLPDATWRLESAGSSSRESPIGRLTLNAPHDQAQQARAIVTVPSLSELHRTAQRNRGRTLRSRCDRTAIAARSNRDPTAFIADLFRRDLTAFPGVYGARSTPDQSPIAARSWSIVVEIVAFLEADLKPNSRGFFVELKPRRRTQRLVPTTPSNDAHGRFYCPRFRA